MARSRQRSTPRVRIPDELRGPYTGLIVGTFGADLAFFEQEILRQIDRSTTRRVILVDARQFAGYLARNPPLRRLNRSYMASPVRSPNAHHPKYLLLMGPDAGLLHIGSGNLSISGYTGPGEAFSTYKWTPDAPHDVAAFAAVRDLIGGLAERDWIDGAVASQIEEFFATIPWIDAASADGPVIHNLERPILDQLVERVNRRPVREIVAHAPFHDRRSEAIRQLLEALQPDRLTLLVQQKRTRLDASMLQTVLDGSPSSLRLVDVDVPPPYQPIPIHAKFLLVRSVDRDFLLVGSPNLSTVALTKSGNSGNVEVANLAVGPPGHFDTFVESLRWAVIEEGLEGFTPDDDWSDDDDNRTLPDLPWDVTWRPPRLSGLVPGPPDETLSFRAGGRSLLPTSSRWVEEGATSRFVAEFDHADAALINESADVEIALAGRGPWVVHPYHLHTLGRLINAETKVELLLETGDLDLGDAELVDLVAELDRVLIVDGRSLWRLAHPNLTSDPPIDDSGRRLSYDDLDWDRIGRLPTVRQYAIGALHGLAEPTALSIALQSLTDRFRTDASAGGGQASDDADDLAIEQLPEEPDVIEDAEITPSRRQGNRARIRRIWRNFVNRFIKGIADPDFVEAVGSNVIVPSYILFNHLCRRLRIVDHIDPDFLTDAQIELWSFMWGSTGTPGYLHSLTPSERSVAIRLLDEHSDLPATLSALDDTLRSLDRSSHMLVALRDALRSLLVALPSLPSTADLEDAARAAVACENPIELLEDLGSLAYWALDSERLADVARSLAVPPERVEETYDTVRRRDNDDLVLTLRVKEHQLNPVQAATVIAVLRKHEPDRSYFRVSADNGVAIVDLENGDQFFHDKATRSEAPLDLDLLPEEPWEAALRRLVGALEPS